MEQKLKDNLMLLRDAFLAATSYSQSTLGRFCAQDTRFFSRLDEGNTFTVRKYDDVVTWFFENWPEKARWPRQVAKPVKVTEE